MAEITCSGDCLGCNVAQRIYCASQHCHELLRNQSEIKSMLTELRSLLSSVKPIEDVASTSDAGAENKASIKRRTSNKKEEQ